MQDLKNTADTLTSHVSDYMETYFKLTVVNATDKATNVASVSLMAILISTCCMFVLLFLGVGVSMWVGEALDNLKLGYFIVGGFFLFCVIIVLALRKTILPSLRDFIIKKVYE